MDKKGKQPETKDQQPQHGQFVSSSLFVCTCDCNDEDHEQEQHQGHFERQPQSQVHGETLSQSASMPKEQQRGRHKDNSHDAKH